MTKFGLQDPSWSCESALDFSNLVGEHIEPSTAFCWHPNTPCSRPRSLSIVEELEGAFSESADQAEGFIPQSWSQDSLILYAHQLLLLSNSCKSSTEKTLINECLVQILQAFSPNFRRVQGIKGSRLQTLLPNVGSLQESLSKLQHVLAIQIAMEKMAFWTSWQCPTSPVWILQGAENTSVSNILHIFGFSTSLHLDKRIAAGCAIQQERVEQNVASKAPQWGCFRFSELLQQLLHRSSYLRIRDGSNKQNPDFLKYSFQTI